jgi:hypothetical protein
VARAATLLFALVSSAFAAFGWVADRALAGQLRHAHDEAGPGGRGDGAALR